MKRALVIMGLLALGLVIALIVRIRHVRAAEHGPAGGTGVIEGVDVNVTSRIATRILRVLVREGDVVRQGDLVVELDCTEQSAALAQAQSQLRAAESAVAAAHANAGATGHNAFAAADTAGAARAQVAALESQARLARVEFERTQRLFAQGALPQQSLDTARSRLDTLQHQIEAQRASTSASSDQARAVRTTVEAATAQEITARDNMAVARDAVTRAEVLAGECRLTAPRNGMIATRVLEPGEAVVAGSVILTLTDVTEARARFYLPNHVLAFAAPGRPVHVVADAYPRQSFRGTIFYVSPRAEFTPRNVQTREDRERLVYSVEVRIPNEDMRLRSGMPVEVTIDGSWR